MRHSFLHAVAGDFVLHVEALDAEGNAFRGVWCSWTVDTSGNDLVCSAQVTLFDRMSFMSSANASVAAFVVIFAEGSIASSTDECRLLSAVEEAGVR